jgi:hypothetical protein
MTDQELMYHVKFVCGPWIDEAAAGTDFPSSFLAALTANESGGDPTKTRLEPKVMADLSTVLIGTKPSYGAIAYSDLLDYVDQGPVDRRIQNAVTSLMHLATSWGPTQIMGYQALAGGYEMADLPNLNKHYHHAIAMLNDFRRRFNLPTVQPAAGGISVWCDFFRCWNTGRPTGQTSDREYVNNGLNRMIIYLGLQ